jgi:hypothetical protein
MEVTKMAQGQTAQAEAQTAPETGQVKPRLRFQIAKQHGRQRIVWHNANPEDVARIAAARASFGSLREAIAHLFPGAVVSEGLD